MIWDVQYSVCDRRMLVCAVISAPKAGTTRTDVVDVPWCIADDANRTSIGSKKADTVSISAAYRGVEALERQNTTPANAITGMPANRNENREKRTTTTTNSTRVGPNRREVTSCFASPTEVLIVGSYGEVFITLHSWATKIDERPASPSTALVVSICKHLMPCFV